MGAASPKEALESLFVEMREKRDAGVRADFLATSDLTGACAAFGLDARAVTKEISSEDAEGIATFILHTELAYGTECMPLVDARRLSAAFREAMGASARFLTNATFQMLAPGYVSRLAGWNPATAATFDAGVVAINDVGVAFIWVEDED